MFVHHGIYYGGGEGGYGGNLSVRQEEVGTTLQAAVRMVGNRGGAWAPETDEAAVLDIVKQLVEHGVDATAVDADGNSVAQGAQKLKFGSVVEYLVSKGATRPPPPAAVQGRGR